MRRSGEKNQGIMKQHVINSQRIIICNALNKSYRLWYHHKNTSIKQNCCMHVYSFALLVTSCSDGLIGWNYVHGNNLFNLRGSLLFLLIGWLGERFIDARKERWKHIEREAMRGRRNTCLKIAGSCHKIKLANVI